MSTRLRSILVDLLLKGTAQHKAQRISLHNVHYPVEQRGADVSEQSEALRPLVD
jgi:hypothetical protein